MDELIKRLEQRLIAAERVKKEHEESSYMDGMISGLNAALETAKDVKREGTFNEF